MERLQKSILLNDLEKKMVFLTGPRQVGKTTLAKSLKSIWKELYYLNYDSQDDRRIMRQLGWDRKAPLVILDEMHKFKKWKTKLKGVYDTEGLPPRILVTGSARMDIYRRGGDSLAGRYFLHRIYPFSVRELRGYDKPHALLESLMRLGGFPEPFLSGSEEEAARWRQQHIERIVRIDVQDLEPVRDIQSMLLLVDLLKERVGSPISYATLALDLEVSPHTVKKWIQTLENMYILFLVTPFHRNLARAHLKQPKIYFYDTGAVRGDDGVKLENATAVCLKKWLHFLEDRHGRETGLHYLRDKEKREVDFVILIDHQMELLVEVKLADQGITSSLKYYHSRLKHKQSIQLVHHARRRNTIDGIDVFPAAEWLDQLEI